MCPHQMVRKVTTANMGTANCRGKPKIILEAPPLSEAGLVAVPVRVTLAVEAFVVGAVRVRAEQAVVHSFFLMRQFNSAPCDAAAHDAHDGSQDEVRHECRHRY